MPGQWYGHNRRAALVLSMQLRYQSPLPQWRQSLYCLLALPVMPLPTGQRKHRLRHRVGRPCYALLLVLLFLDLKRSGVSPVPICAHGDSGCHFLTVSDLFDRVIQHSDRMHSLSNDLYSDFREELIQVILRLLLAWKNPLLQFHQNFGRYDKLDDASRSKAREMSEMVHELKTGVEKVAEKMQLMGIINNSLAGISSSEATGLLASGSNEARLMNDYELLHCFRRDSNKVQSYLKILKCRIAPKNSC
nr:PREDICTED: prolactin-like [Latimeria chalumnae]|eukprot:XP_006012513.1 PREDICTED: prolactin-like [Latimeria chalumnae]